MIPNHTITPVPQFWYYIPPDELDPSMIEDFEFGGIGLNDPSQGLQVQVWRAFIGGGVNNIFDVMVESATQPATVLFSLQGITQISLAFDQNMHPFIAFVQNGQAKFWWFDPTIPGHTFTTLPVGSLGPQCGLDDKRLGNVGGSDIILSYVRGSTLYWREQRDRYLIEYTVGASNSKDLIRVGMNGILRFQWALGEMPLPGQVNILRTATEGRRRVTTQGNNRQVVGTIYV